MLLTAAYRSILLEWSEHALLGHRVDLGRHGGARREALPRKRHQGPAASVRGTARQGQQGGRRVKYHVYRGPISAVFTCALEVLEDSSEQTVRVYARTPSWSAGQLLALHCCLLFCYLYAISWICVICALYMCYLYSKNACLVHIFCNTASTATAAVVRIWHATPS